MLTEEDVREIILEKIEQIGSQRAFAKEASISAAYVNDYVHFRRHPGPGILEFVGLRAVTMYRRVKL